MKHWSKSRTIWWHLGFILFDGGILVTMLAIDWQAHVSVETAAVIVTALKMLQGAGGLYWRSVTTTGISTQADA